MSLGAVFPLYSRPRCTGPQGGKYVSFLKFRFIEELIENAISSDLKCYDAIVNIE